MERRILTIGRVAVAALAASAVRECVHALRTTADVAVTPAGVSAGTGG